MGGGGGGGKWDGGGDHRSIPFGESAVLRANGLIFA